MSDLTNPKDAIGQAKAPLDLWPEIATAYGSLALYEGALKYGKYNWRHSKVRASVYIAAAKRHLAKWIEGQECDEKTTVPHLASVLGCIAILIDAEQSCTLIDDRSKAPYHLPGSLEEMEHTMRTLRGLHGDDMRLLPERE